MTPARRHFESALLIAALAVSAACGAFAATAPSPVDPAAWDSLQVLEDRLAWAQQESLATSIVRQLEQAPAMDSLAYSRALLNVATGRLRRRLFRDGVGFDALERSLAIRERRGDPADPLLAKGHWLAATMYAENAEPERARAHGEAGLRAVALAAPVDTLMQSRIHLTLANAQVGLGHRDEARVHYARALELREGKFGANHRVLVPTLAEYGGFLSRGGEFDEARAQLARAVVIAERDTAPGSDLLEGTLLRLSSLEDRSGNVAESMELALRAWDVTRERRGPDDVQTLRARTVVAYRHEELGDPEAAAGHLAAIVPAVEAKLGAANPQTINARLVWIEQLLAIGDTATAGREIARLGPSLAGQERLFNENRAHQLALFARLAHARGESAAAHDSLDEAIRLERTKDDPLGETLAGTLVHALNALDGPGDRARLDRLGAEIERLRDSTRVRAMPAWVDLVLARARAEARVGLALAAWEHGLEAERRARERFRYEIQGLPDHRALQLGQRIGGATELLVHLAAAGDAAAIGTAWDRVARWRGLVRHEIEHRRAPAAIAADTALVAAHARWTDAQRRLAQWVVSGWADPEDPESAARFAAARHDAEDAERAFLRVAPAAAIAADSLDLATVLAGLGAEQALVAFALSSDGAGAAELGAFVARGGGGAPRWVALGPLDGAERTIRDWTAQLAVPPLTTSGARSAEARARARGKDVRGLLWEPIARAAGGATTLFVVPEGPLFEVPWMALPSGPTGYLADEAVAIEILGAERELIDRAGERGTGLLAVGGPEFDAPALVAAAVSSSSARTSARRWPCAAGAGTLAALPHARAEAEEIARLWDTGDARTLVGREATEENFKRAAEGRLVVHLATHGVVLEDSCRAAAVATRGVGGVEPIASPRPRARRTTPAAAPTLTPARPAPSFLRGRVWLALAGANRTSTAAADENEGLLTAEEVVTLDLRGTDWVVLSACQSGVAPTWSREGVLGMRRAFHVAGARAVIASHWPVADQATREWMSALYAARARHGTAGAAVRDACRAVLAERRREGRSTLPFYWAAFTPTGR